MKSSWKIGTVAGIGIYLHVTFLILLGWVGFAHYLHRHRWEDALGGLGFIAALFAIVVLHELGHALAAKRFGIRTRDITLYPIGGLARLERIPENPKEELLVALAGPAVNVILAGLLLGIVRLGTQLADPASLAEFQLVGGNFLTKLMWVNVSLALFNLLPAFPMDGGRALRALLATKMSYARATNIAAHIGQGMAWLFGFIGLFFNPFLVFIALFVWAGAAAEAGMVQVKLALTDVPVSGVMITDFRTLAPRDTLQRATDYVLSGYQHDFPVIEDGQIMGILTRTDLLTGLSGNGSSTTVETVMHRDIATAESSEMVADVWNRLQNHEYRILPVVRDGRLAGILTTENIGEYLLIHEALKKESDGGQNPAKWFPSSSRTMRC